MTNPTSNFGWQMPTSTDLVTDLPADFETFGQAVDTSLADLKGGTSGQILSKASNTDMDFTWITNDVGDITAVTAGTGISGGGTSGAVTITNSMATAIDAKGDLIAGTGADAFSRLAVGANDLLLTAASGEATGLKYTGGWTTWTPTLVNITQGNGTIIARYQQIGKNVNFYFRFTLGSTSAITGNYPRFTLPFTPVNNAIVAYGVAADSGVAGYTIGAGMFTATEMFPTIGNTGGAYLQESVANATVPFTWGTNDWFVLQGSFEVA